MREYKLTGVYDFLDQNFSFLEKDWGFEKIRSEELNYGSYLEFSKEKLIIYLGYDYKDNFFYFEFKRNKERFPIMLLFKEKEPKLDLKRFEPDDFQYKDALMLNIQYLKKYKEDIFRMAEDSPFA